MRTGRWRAALTLACVGLIGAAGAAGCGSTSSGVKAPTIGAARTFKLAGFEPTGEVQPASPTRVAFTIQEPSGKPLTRYKKGPGPHTGVHLIIVRDDLSTIIHKHPPVAADGKIVQPLAFSESGPYRVLVDAYPGLSATQPNFQLFSKVRVAGNYRAQPLPPFRQTVDVGGYRFTMHSIAHLKALQASFLTVTVTDPKGRRATFTPWYGALAHAIFFRAGTLDYFHTHVCGAGATNCTSVLGGSRVAGRSSTPGKLEVGVLLPVKGTWRLFLQCKVQGRILTAPYTLKVS